jgi:hypothetical protein
MVEIKIRGPTKVLDNKIDPDNIILRIGNMHIRGEALIGEVSFHGRN